MRFLVIWALVMGGAALGRRACAASPEPCGIEIVEKGSGWPVPMVELRTTHQMRWVSDNSGWIALTAPELMGRDVWFEIHGYGYGVPADGFGHRGVRLHPTPGGRLRVEVERSVVARRLGRLTGSGRWGDSIQLGLEPDVGEDGVFGCDSVLVAAYRGRLYWAWGDTTLPGYPLGRFHTTSATTPSMPQARWEPPVRWRYEHFRDAKGEVRDVAHLPGEGPTWLTAYTSLHDRAGTEHLVATYQKIRPPMEAYEIGLCVWNDGKASFEPLRKVWVKTADAPAPPPHPQGHPAFWRDAQGAVWVLFGDPFPALRCRARFEAWQDPAAWEVLKSQDSLSSAEGATRVRPHRGSVAWNPFRSRWVTVFTQALGKPSAFGEIWYAEAKSPLGPWGPAVRILSHENYTFYNPRVHPELTPAESSTLLFEGTFSMQFADRPAVVPRYDYNQILYRLDLEDPRLRAAQEP